MIVGVFYILCDAMCDIVNCVLQYYIDTPTKFIINWYIDSV